jgi:hypothetical protein
MAMPRGKFSSVWRSPQFAHGPPYLLLPMGQNESSPKAAEDHDGNEVLPHDLANSVASTSPSSVSFARSRSEFNHIKSRLSKWEVRSLYAAFNDLKTTFSDNFECIELKKFLVNILCSKG